MCRKHRSTYVRTTYGFGIALQWLDLCILLALAFKLPFGSIHVTVAVFAVVDANRSLLLVRTTVSYSGNYFTRLVDGSLTWRGRVSPPAWVMTPEAARTEWLATLPPCRSTRGHNRVMYRRIGRRHVSLTNQSWRKWWKWWKARRTQCVGRDASVPPLIATVGRYAAVQPPWASSSGWGRLGRKNGNRWR